MSSIIPIKNEEEIKKIREACRLAQDVLVYLDKFVKIGVSTLELNELAHNYIVNIQKATPAPLNYHGFPKSICTSINDVICHGIPSDKDLLKNGDILNIDVTVIKDGYYGDNSKMYLVGEVSERNKILCNLTQYSLYEAIKIVKPGNNFSQIGEVIQEIAIRNNLGIVREYTGHGIGTEFHCEPNVLHYVNNDKRVFEAGMIFTIEPMLNLGTHHTRTMKDGWTVKTRDKSNSAQYEHQILVTKTGCEILTIREEELIKGLNRYY